MPMFEDIEKRIGSTLGSIQQLKRWRWGRVSGRTDSDRACGGIVGRSEKRWQYPVIHSRAVVSIEAGLRRERGNLLRKGGCY